MVGASMDFRQAYRAPMDHSSNSDLGAARHRQFGPRTITAASSPRSTGPDRAKSRQSHPGRAQHSTGSPRPLSLETVQFDQAGFEALFEGEEVGGGHGANIPEIGLKHYPKRYPDMMDYREDGAKPPFLRQGTTD